MMLEYLALPGWNTPPTRVAAWVERLNDEAGGPVVLSRESSNVAWLESAPLRIRAYVMVEDGHAAAINFELHAPDPAPATLALGRAAEALGWELHADDGEDDDDEGDD